MSLKNTVHAFKSGEIADALVEVGKREMAGGSGSRAPTGREVRIAKTPAAGIPAATLNAGEMELESAVCEIKQTGVALTTPVTRSTKIEVWNITDSTITGDTFIMAVRHGGAWIAATGGTGTTTAMFVSTSTITGNSEGTANIRTFNGTSWTTDTGTSYTIVNPWADDVSTAKNLTAYSHSSGKCIMIQAECEDPV